MKQRLFFRLLAAGLFMLLLAGCTDSFQSNFVAGGTTKEPEATIFVSKQAPVMVSILVNPEQLESSWGLGGEISKLKSSLFADTGIDYKQDIQPWLGNEITLAVTSSDIDRDPNNGRQPGYLMAIATKTPSKSREFVDLFFSKRAKATGSSLAVEEYEGVKLISDYSQTDKVLSGAVVGDRFVLFANDPKVLREAINNVQAAQLNLTSSSQYQQAVKQVPQKAFALAFLNLPAVAQWQGWKLPETATFNSEVISLVLPNRKQLQVETIFLAEKQTLPTSEVSSPSQEALQYIPTSAGLVVSGANLSNLDRSNLALLWEQIATSISSGSGEEKLSELLQPLVDLQQRWDINLKEDIFSWVQGEYAIGLIPRPQNTNPDWIFVVEKSPATPAAISHLDAIATSKGLSLNSFDLDKQKISAWTFLKATKVADASAKPTYTLETEVYGVHTTQGNYEIFASNLGTIEEVLARNNNSFAQNRTFQDNIAPIPQPNQGYVYLDWVNGGELVKSQLPILKLLEIVAKPFFQKLRSLTLSSYGSDSELLKIGMFLQFDGF
jgi:hypothetical protein